MLTKEQIQSALPVSLRTQVSQELVDTVNNVSNDPEIGKIVRENFLSYSKVMKEGRFKTEDYLHAVTYVSYKVMGYSNQEAYEMTFPARYLALRARGVPDKGISSYVAAYNKNQLVNLILEQTLIPTWVLNQDAYQEAINVQVTLMATARSEKVRSDAANSLLTHLKRPEVSKIEMDIGVKESEGMVELRQMLTSLAKQQQDAIEHGIPTRDIAHQKLIKEKVVDAEVVPNKP